MRVLFFGLAVLGGILLQLWLDFPAGLILAVIWSLAMLGMAIRHYS